MTRRRSVSEVSKIMSLVRARNTRPEQLLSKLMTSAGVRHQRHPRNLPGHPDFILRKVRVAIFVDGDFWHGRQWKIRGHSSLSAQFKNCPNRDYWVRKIQKNISRDRRVSRELRELGWSVIRCWERDLVRRPKYCVRRVLRALENEDGQ